MKKLKQLIENFFGFSAKETIGFLALMMLNIILCGLILFKPWHFFKAEKKIGGDKHLDSLVTAWRAKIIADSISFWKNLQPFNPNQSLSEDWQALGFDDHVAERIVKVSKSAHGIRDFKHFSKIYGVDSALAEKLKPFLIFNGQLQVLKTNTSAKVENSAKQIERFDINKADTTQLKTIHGIGSTLAKRIAGYRQQLGGFVHEGQIFEVYKLDSAVAEKILKKFFIDKNFIPKQIKINTSSISDLTAHPYIDFKSAQAIVNYRKQHGNYKTAADLKSIKIIQNKIIEKITPYLSFAE